MLEKQKNSTAASSRLAKPTTAEPAASRLTGTARSRMALAAKKAAEGEESKPASRLGSSRKSIGGLATSGLSSSRLTAGRTSIRPGENPPDSARTTRASQGSRLRSSSKEGADKDLKFGRNTSASRDKDISGLTRTRNSSSSRERIGLNFNKQAA